MFMRLAAVTTLGGRQGQRPSREARERVGVGPHAQ
jgi:hypothetical protein